MRPGAVSEVKKAQVGAEGCVGCEEGEEGCSSWGMEGHRWDRSPEQTALARSEGQPWGEAGGDLRSTPVQPLLAEFLLCAIHGLRHLRCRLSLTPYNNRVGKARQLILGPL